MVEVTEDAFFAKQQVPDRRSCRCCARSARGYPIDDFGTGYSSLATLADITADEIKIDRSFITAIHERPRSQSILKAIEALSDALGMTVIAEGRRDLRGGCLSAGRDPHPLRAGLLFRQAHLYGGTTHRLGAWPGQARSGASARYRTPARR